ncbi:MAG: cell wall-associated NlpC family hydrolase [Actinomycetes bacterium]|jgi:cell wall-associated NlpC family hydrolase
MRQSRLVGASIAVAATAAIAAPVATTSVANATVSPAAAASTIAPADAKADRRAAKARARHLKAKSTRKSLVTYAKKRLQRGQYVAGASSPWRFDCSGFTKIIYKEAAGITIPHYSGAQLRMKKGKRVSKNNLKKGDLLLWGSGGGQHASMYIGKGRMIGANNPSRDVVIESINNSYWKPRYAGSRRLIFG